MFQIEPSYFNTSSLLNLPQTVTWKNEMLLKILTRKDKLQSWTELDLWKSSFNFDSITNPTKWQHNIKQCNEKTSIILIRFLLQGDFFSVAYRAPLRSERTSGIRWPSPARRAIPQSSPTAVAGVWAVPVVRRRWQSCWCCCPQTRCVGGTTGMMMMMVVGTVMWCWWVLVVVVVDNMVRFL